MRTSKARAQKKKIQKRKRGSKQGSKKGRKSARVDKNVTKPSGENSKKATNVFGTDMLKQFENWQKMMSESYLQSMKAYSEMMNKFAETWKKMPQN